VWSANVVWQAAGAGAMPDGTYDTLDPLLAAQAGGVFRPQSGSPAVDSAVGEYPAVTFDMDGQVRVAPKDRGSDEVSAAPIGATLLTPGDLLRLIHSRP
jgi:poly(beta-D-mannuronate) lyase